MQEVETEDVHAVQAGGDHYLKMDIKPWDVVDAHDLDFYEGNVIKYVLRYKTKGQPIKDLEKLVHYSRKLLDRELKRELKR